MSDNYFKYLKNLKNISIDDLNDLDEEYHPSQELFKNRSKYKSNREETPNKKYKK